MRLHLYTFLSNLRLGNYTFPWNHQLYFIPVFIYTSIKVKSKRGRKKNIRQANDFSFGQHRYNTQHHLQPWRNNQRNNREHHHRQNAMQYISYIPKYTSNQPLKNDFAQSFSLAFIIQKNALILYSFSEEKKCKTDFSTILFIKYW